MTITLAPTVTVETHPIAVVHPVHQTDSDDVLFWWTAIIGPSAASLAHRLARYATVHGPIDWELDELAQLTGINVARLTASFERLKWFGIISITSPAHVYIRPWLPALSLRLLDRLPADVAEDYHARFITGTITANAS